MVCGYTEPAHEVIEHVDLVHPDKADCWLRIERCQPTPYRHFRDAARTVTEPAYLRVTPLNAEKQPRWRYLFLFTEPDAARLDEAWRLLTTQPPAVFSANTVKDIPWDEFIDGDYGHTREGGFIMY